MEKNDPPINQGVLGSGVIILDKGQSQGYQGLTR